MKLDRPLSTSPPKNYTFCIIMVFLCDSRADINALDSEGQISLFHAAKAGNDHATGLLLMRPDIEVKVLDGNSLISLRHAASRGHMAVANRLLQYPTIIAVDNGHHRILKALLESGNIDHHTTDADGRSALGYAVYRRNCEAVRLPIEASIDSGREDIATIAHLHMVVVQGVEDMVKALLGAST
ncbi:hypothetical protein N8T08_009652 [Aspergillus melleus]|uniref:Uncharacterized protein n=1 Tax=Aspergillus melleus TaxID=138277 RepID=A0ACC3ATQ8_9EURO|nr:hypothetical protein N8T08_009652 [Aspergillus melleus]